MYDFKTYDGPWEALAMGPLTPEIFAHVHRVVGKNQLFRATLQDPSEIGYTSRSTIHYTQQGLDVSFYNKHHRYPQTGPPKLDISMDKVDVAWYDDKGLHLQYDDTTLVINPTDGLEVKIGDASGERILYPRNHS